MIISSQVPLHRLVLSLSDALDLVHPLVAAHQQRVGYVALHMARHLDVPEAERNTLFLAAALHDIGLVRTENRVRSVHVEQLEEITWHEQTGFELLQDSPLFGETAEIVRHHHARWDRSRGHDVSFASHIIAVADSVERFIDRRNPILAQKPVIVQKILAGAGSEFQPDCAEAFAKAAQTEAFWLDLVSPRIFSLLLDLVDWPMLQLNAESITQIAQIFSRVVDAMSPWTATHSAGVTAAAVALAARMGFSQREQVSLRAAGYLHDLGKLAIPSSILDKPGRLSGDERAIVQAHTYHTFRILETIGGIQQINEWASFHHERLDGKGYPFHHGAGQLTLGSRIMAVADIFTAITEERPYRVGMNRQQAMAVLDQQAIGGAIDGDVVAIVRRDYEAISAACREEAQTYARQQKRLIEAASPGGRVSRVA